VGLPGPTGPLITAHPAPADSREAFPADGILAVPAPDRFRIRIKVLEAWARGLPVVATPEAAAGLGAEGSHAVLTAREPAAFGDAIAALSGDPSRGRALAAAGQSILRARHDPGRVAASLESVYRAALAGRPRPG
jgi:glycosyltransferase involved in cell wall biosynthesis